MSHSPYTPPTARVADQVAASDDANHGWNARVAATRFAAAAAVVVVAGTIVSGVLPNDDPGPFGSPSLLQTLVAALFFAIGAFIWSWAAVAATAKLARAATPGSMMMAIILGALFALLTPALGFTLDHLGTGIGLAILAMSLWVISYPVIASLILVRGAHLNR